MVNFILSLLTSPERILRRRHPSCHFCLLAVVNVGQHTWLLPYFVFPPLKMLFTASVFSLFTFLFLPAVPAQPSDFEAEAELDSRIMLSWLWPVQDPIISFELLYWEANNPTDKVNTTLKT